MTIAWTPSPAPSLSSDVIGDCAMAALRAELTLFPKPGLVSPVDCGAHDDMDAETFVRSLAALDGYFSAMANAGAAGASFAVLQQRGIDAEVAMLSATDGINTHRGAIFSLGLLAAGAGHLAAAGRSLAGAAIGRAVSHLWGAAVRDAAMDAPSHGARAAQRHGVRGVRHVAAAGFPILFEKALPVLRRSVSMQRPFDAALVQTLFVLIADLDDTNLLHRGGAEGLAYAKAQARAFLRCGGVAADDWHSVACAIHHAFVARRLSPGGAADMLAATYFVLLLQDRFA